MNLNFASHTLNSSTSKFQSIPFTNFNNDASQFSIARIVSKNTHSNIFYISPTVCEDYIRAYCVPLIFIQFVKKKRLNLKFENTK